MTINEKQACNWKPTGQQGLRTGKMACLSTGHLAGVRPSREWKSNSRLWLSRPTPSELNPGLEPVVVNVVKLEAEWTFWRNFSIHAFQDILLNHTVLIASAVLVLFWTTSDRKPKKEQKTISSSNMLFTRPASLHYHQNEQTSCNFRPRWLDKNKSLVARGERRFWSLESARWNGNENETRRSGTRRDDVH